MQNWGQNSFLGDDTMKKVFALTVVFAAFFAAGCAEKKETVPPPAQDQAAPAEEAPAQTPADDAKAP
jgi:hypothetical protein